MADVRDKVKGGIDDAASQAKQATDRVADAAQGAARTAQGGQHGSQQGAKDQAHGLVDQAKGTVQSVVGQATDLAHQARDKAGNLLDQGREKLQGLAGSADLQGAADKAQHWAEDAYAYAGDNLGDVGREVTTMVRRYPIPALLVGFGVGLLLGRMVRA